MKFLLKSQRSMVYLKWTWENILAPKLILKRSMITTLLTSIIHHWRFNSNLWSYCKRISLSLWFVTCAHKGIEGALNKKLKTFVQSSTNGTTIITYALKKFVDAF
jgi:hypothetical protein